MFKIFINFVIALNLAVLMFLGYCLIEDKVKEKINNRNKLETL